MHTAEQIKDKIHGARIAFNRLKSLREAGAPVSLINHQEEVVKQLYKQIKQDLNGKL